MTSPPPGGDPYGQWGGYPQQGPHGTQYAAQPGYGGPPDQGQYGQSGPYQPGHYSQSGPYQPPYQPQGAYQPPGGGYPPYQPPPSGPNRTGLIVGIVVVVVALVAAGGAGWYFLSGPGSPQDDTGNVATGSTTPSAIPGVNGGPSTIPSAPPAPPGPPEDPDNDGIPGLSAGSDGGGSFDLDVEIGDCILLGGTVEDATTDVAECGTFDANYKVVAKAPSSDECPADVDQSVFQSFDDVEVGALCLDIDFVQGDCFELSGGDPLRVDCAAPPGLDTVKVTDTIRGNGDIGACPQDNGVPYPERGFVVCLESL